MLGISRYFAVLLFISVGVACADGAGHKPAAHQLTGVLVEGGVECPLFQADDGMQYTLLGDLKGLQHGDRVQLTGEEVEVSFCMQGKTLSVKSIKKVR